MRINKILVSLLVLFAPIAYGSAGAAPTADSGAPTSDSSSSAEYSPQSREYHLKAAFLRYVAKFVEWPAGAITSGSINICILGLIPSFEATGPMPLNPRNKANSADAFGATRTGSPSGKVALIA